MLDLFPDIISVVQFLSSALRLSMPLIFAALAGVLSERSGVFNVGLEGFILMGAFGAALGTFHTGSPFIGVLVGMALGLLLALPMATMSISLGVNQIVAGVAINLFALGITAFLARIAIGASANTQLLPGFRPIAIPILSGIPVIGPVLFNQDLLVYAMYLLVPILYVLIYRTPLGLSIRAVGHNPRACDTAGVPVVSLRYGCVLVSGALAAMGGVYLVLSQVFVFSEHMSAGKGFIALAAVILGRWNPVGALLACLLFGIFDAFQLRLQFQNPEVPYQIFSTLPYVVSIIALVLVAGRNVSPQAVGKHYHRESH
ncbi:simple sugar transport system permease protein [Rhodoligotrophos appendicifer]|uniref:ABC transporter permease n=1 Tax=Rhodoligotrophos appendicifer TaxID=987056 RepID=UPI0011805074|nr:ABC transporter permease [Rhodoligotrophos appendicifer]